MKPVSLKILTSRNLLLVAAAFLTAWLTATATRHCLKQGHAPAAAPVARLADDVDALVKGYKYQESRDGFQLKISGAQSVRRGRRFLGLRSTMVKSVFFKDVQGELKTAQKRLSFSAEDAEWSGEDTQPFLLKSGVTLEVNGEKLPHAKRAKIYFRQRVLEVDDGPDRRVFNL